MRSGLLLFKWSAVGWTYGIKTIMAEVTVCQFFLVLGLENHWHYSPTWRLTNIRAEHFITVLVLCSSHWEWKQGVMKNITSRTLIFETKRQGVCSQFFASEYWQYRLILQYPKVLTVVCVHCTLWESYSPKFWYIIYLLSEYLRLFPEGSLFRMALAVFTSCTKHFPS